MEPLMPYEEKILRYFRKSRKMKSFSKRFGKESLPIVEKMYGEGLLSGQFEHGDSFRSGNLTDYEPSGVWSITPNGRLYFRQTSAAKSKRIKDLLLEHLISFGFGLASGLIVGVATAYYVFISHWR